LTFIRHDVTQPFAHIFSEYKIDTAVHLAFIVAPVRDESRAHRINIEGSKNFLAAAQAEVEQVFYMGSNMEYGARRSNPPFFTEDIPLNPNPDYPYSRDKAQVDLMFQDFAKENPGICVTIGRTAAVTGPHGDECGLTVLFLPVMIKSIAHNPLWQFIHEDDLTEWVVLLLKNRTEGIYNFAGHGGLTYSEMIKKLRKPSLSLPSWLLYRGIEITWKLRLQARSQAGGMAMIQYPIILNNEKVIRATGYRPRYTGQEAFGIFLRAVGKGTGD
jgi:nucleoside-diphosphate-sugar epimerase